MTRKRKRFCVAGLALTALCLAGCGTKNIAENEIELLAPAEAVVDIETVMRRDLYALTTRDAELAPYTKELSFEAVGNISKMYVELGSEVKKGDLLAELEEEGVRNDANNALNKYLSEKKVYMDTVKKAKKSLAAGLGKEEKERQELLLEQAEEIWKEQEPILWEAWETAKAKLGKNKIYAPFDGVVTACLKQGANVAAGQPAIAVADTDRLYITAGTYLAPTDYQMYKEIYGIVNGKETELTYEEELMEEEGTYTYYTAEDLNGASMGDLVLICMVNNYHSQVLSVPESVIYRDSNGAYVYLQEDGSRVRRDVILGYTSGIYVEIAEGLQEGDRVYVKK